MQVADKVLDWLVFAAAQRTKTDSGDPWPYGWSVEKHRRSGEALIEHPSGGNVRLSENGMRAFESAVHQLLKRGEIAERWSTADLWETGALLVMTLPLEEEPAAIREKISRRLNHLMSAQSSCVGLCVANVAWNGAPMRLGNMVIGRIDAAWWNLIAASKDGRPSLAPREDVWWMEQSAGGSSQDPGPPIGIVVWTPFQRTLALSRARAAFEQLVDLALVLEEDLDGRGIWSLRGSQGRPGLRGLVVDRQSLFRAHDSVREKIGKELCATAVVVGDLSQEPTHLWHAVDPLPLEQLVQLASQDVDLGDLIDGTTDMHLRLHTAAKWHSRAHWTIDASEAVLACGIAFDALLGSEGPQRRELAERYALLHPVPLERRAAYELFANSFYTARCEVAHGGHCSALDDSGFVRRFLLELRITFRRVLQAMRAHHIMTGSDFAEYFATVKWGGRGTCSPEL